MPSSSRNQSTWPAVKGNEATGELGEIFLLEASGRGGSRAPITVTHAQPTGESPLSFVGAVPFLWTCFPNDLKMQINWWPLIHFLS